MIKKDKRSTPNCIVAMIPTDNSLANFLSDSPPFNKNILKNIIEYCKKSKTINISSIDDLKKSINKCSAIITIMPPENMTFKTIYYRIIEKTTAKLLINDLNCIAAKFNFLKTNETILSRLLKKFATHTSMQKNFLCLLSFWLYENIPDLDINYEMLKNLPKDSNRINEPSGVFVGISLKSDGEAIKRNEMIILNKLVMEICQEYGVFEDNHIELDIYAIGVKFPKLKGPVYNPQLFTKPIQNALSFSQQLIVKWMLSKQINTHKAIKIVIDSGNLNNSREDVLFLLNLKLPGDPTILLSNNAYIIAKYSEVKTQFAHFEKEILGKNILIDIWHVIYMWTNTYYDIISELLSEKMLPKTHNAYLEFKNQIFFPDSDNEIKFNAILAMNKFQNSDLLLLEIAKVCIARKMFYEADSILSKVLLLNRNHCVARVMRMTIKYNLAIRFPTYEMFSLGINSAIAEGEAIIKKFENCQEIYSELGMVYFIKGVEIIKRIRSRQIQINGEFISTIKDALIAAITIFSKGILVTPTGKDSRCFFWLLSTESILSILSKNPEFLFGNHELYDKSNDFREIAFKYFKLLGWVGNEIKVDTVTKDDCQTILRHLSQVAEVYGNTVIARHFRPNAYIAFCSLLWDFSPNINVGSYKQILKWLDSAISEAKLLISHNITIYSSITCSAFCQLPKNFIRCVEEIKHCLTGIVPNSVVTFDDHFLIDDIIQNKLDISKSEKKNICEKIISTKLLLMHFDVKPDQNVYIDKLELEPDIDM